MPSIMDQQPLWGNCEFISKASPCDPHNKYGLVQKSLLPACHYRGSGGARVIIFYMTIQELFCESMCVYLCVQTFPLKRDFRAEALELILVQPQALSFRLLSQPFKLSPQFHSSMAPQLHGFSIYVCAVGEQEITSMDVKWIGTLVLVEHGPSLRFLFI